jgi:GT2 family glycosyltransferase
LPPEVNILRLPTNRGFAGGMNAGMREALKDPATDSVLFLNNDTRCPPELVGSMRAVLAADSKVGLVGCDMEGAGGGESAPAGFRLSRCFGFPKPCRSGKSPDFLQGSCLLLPRDVLETVGGFDEDFEFFFEDSDLSLRVRQLGRKLSVVPGVRIFHYGSATLSSPNSRAFEKAASSHRIFLKKWYSHPRLRSFGAILVNLGYHACRLHVRTIIQLIRGYIAGGRKIDLNNIKSSAGSSRWPRP